MSTIKEVPIGWNVYYKSMLDAYTQKRDEAFILLEDLRSSVKVLQEEIKSNKDTYKNEFNVDLFDYEEFVNNEYTNGSFLRVAKSTFLNRRNNYTLVSDLFDLYNLAKKQKDIYDVKKDIELYNNILDMDAKTYRRLLNMFYNEVQKQLILKGKGYAFEGSLGWICINRCKVDKIRPHLDYAATKKKKEEILAQGKRLYNPDEAKWCKENNIEYDGVPYRVFQKLEYLYEVPLIGCRLPNGRQFKLELSDYRGPAVRGKTNDQLIEEANGDPEYICNLPLGLKAKLNICLKIDKTLYSNFIRNEDQKPINVRKTCR